MGWIRDFYYGFKLRRHLRHAEFHGGVIRLGGGGLLSIAISGSSRAGYHCRGCRQWVAPPDIPVPSGWKPDPMCTAETIRG